MGCELDWRARLGQAIENDPRAIQVIALEAGLSPTFVSELRRTENRSVVDSFLALCETLAVSPIYVLTGAPHDALLDALVWLWGKADKRWRESLLTLLLQSA